jgi:hypothetical protein
MIYFHMQTLLSIVLLFLNFMNYDKILATKNLKEKVNMEEEEGRKRNPFLPVSSK